MTTRKPKHRRTPKAACEAAPRSKRSVRAPHRFLPRIIVLGLTMVICVVGLQWSLGPTEVALEPPLPDLAHVERAVAQRIREATEQVRKQSGSENAWGRLGAVFDVHGFAPAAIECYERAWTLDSEDFRWPYFLAICWRTSDQEKATTLFLRAAELKGDHAPLHVNLGEALARVERFDESEASYRRAVELDAACAPGWAGLARLALTRGEVEAAIPLLQAALSHAPHYREAHRLMAEVHRRCGGLVDAEREDRLAGLSAPGVPLPDSVRDALWWNEGVSLKWRRRRAAAYLEAKRGDDAIMEWEQALGAYAESEDAHFGLAETLAATGRPDEAAAHYRRAIGLRPGFAQAHANLGVVLAAEGGLVRQR